MFNIIWALSLIKSFWIIKNAVKQGDEPPTLFYFELINQLIYALGPIVFYKNVHMNLKDIGATLEKVACNTLLPDHKRFKVILKF